jgi:hypothetical protein
MATNMPSVSIIDVVRCVGSEPSKWTRPFGTEIDVEGVRLALLLLVRFLVDGDAYDKRGSFKILSSSGEREEAVGVGCFFFPLSLVGKSAGSVMTA